MKKYNEVLTYLVKLECLVLQVVVATLLGTDMSSHSKRYRRAAELVQSKTLNLGQEFDEDFPVVFNILLWFAIAFIFTLLAISREFDIIIFLC